MDFQWISLDFPWISRGNSWGYSLISWDLLWISRGAHCRDGNVFLPVAWFRLANTHFAPFCCAALMSVPWAKRLPRKRRADVGAKQEARPILSVPPPRTARSGTGRAADEATLTPTARNTRRRFHKADDHGVVSTGLAAMAERLAVGRTTQNLLTLMNTRLFQTDEAAVSPVLRPQPGLFATHKEDLVFIIDSMTRHRVPMFDVIPLKSMAEVPNEWLLHLRGVRTCAASELQDVTADYVVEAEGRGTRTVFKCRPLAPGEKHCHAEGKHAESLWAAAHKIRLSQPVQGGSALDPNKRSPQPRVWGQVVPAAATKHIAEVQEAGETHILAPRPDRENDRQRFILDVPLPCVVDLRPLRCTTCRNRPGASDREFPVLAADIQREWPGVLRINVAKSRREYVTGEFLEYVLRVFYETMNVREVRRRLVDLYATHALAEARKAARAGLFPSS